MTIWEKAIINLEKGVQKVSLTAAWFSERVKAEIALARLRIRMEEVTGLIKEQEQAIGKRILDLRKKDLLPKTTDLLMADEEIVTAFAELASRERDMEDIHREIAIEQSALKPPDKSGEDKAP